LVRPGARSTGDVAIAESGEESRSEGRHTCCRPRGGRIPLRERHLLARQRVG
jgi:hypothetical protein